MRRVMRRLSRALVLLFGSGSAWAADQPPEFPTRDVSVTVKVTIGPLSYVAESLYLAAERKQRDNISNAFPGMGEVYAVFDFKNKITLMIQAGSPPTYTSQTLPEVPSMKYTRTGRQERIAGHECDVWETPLTEMKNPVAGYPGMQPTYTTRASMCVTKDGVKLRTVTDTTYQGSSSRHIIEATAVMYGTLDPSLFRVPAGAARRQ
jgi:hypothetical protein